MLLFASGLVVMVLVIVVPLAFVPLRRYCFLLLEGAPLSLEILNLLSVFLY